jgi:hypothetical protein
MPCKYVVVPADIGLLDDDDQPVMTPAKEGETAAPLTASWAKVMLGLLAHPRLASNVASLKSNNLLKRKIKGATAGAVVEVPDEDWKRLNDILTDPDKLDEKGQQSGVNVLASLVGYVPRALPQLVDFFAAWSDASDKPPRDDGAALRALANNLPPGRSQDAVDSMANAKTEPPAA